MLYCYENIENINLTKLTIEIENSGMSTGVSLTSLRWDEDIKELCIYFAEELVSGDKAILDYLISNHTVSFPELDFNMNLFFARFAETFGVIKRHEFAVFAPSFTVEINYRNFPEIKELRDHLVSTEQLTQEDANTITDLFAEQNIDLDSY